MDALALRGFASDLVRDALGRSGRTIRDIEILVDWDADGVILRRAQIGHEWAGERSMGTPLPVRCRLKAEWTETRTAKAATRFVENAIALSDRQKAIADHLEDDALPAWSMLAEPTALALLRHTGHPDSEILRFRRPEAGRYTVCDQGFVVGEALSRAHGISISGLGVSGGILDAGRISFGSSSGASAVYRGGRRPRIEMNMPDLPETIVKAIPRRRIREIVDHPALRGLEATAGAARVEACRRTGQQMLSINISSDLVPMAPAPDGADTDWLRTLARR